MFGGKNEPKNEVREAENRLSDLGVKLKELDENCAKKETEAAFLDAEIAKKKDELSSTSLAVATADKERAEAVGAKKVAEDEVAAIARSLESLKEASAVEQVSLKENTDKANEQLAKVLKDVSEGVIASERSQQKLSALESQVDAEKSALAEIEATLEKKKKEGEEASTALMEVTTSTSKKEEELALLDLAIIAAKKEGERLKYEQEEAGKEQHKELASAAEALAAERKAFEEMKASAEEELAQAGVSAAKRTAWNEDVRKKLVQYKSELEAHYKREFKDLII